MSEVIPRQPTLHDVARLAGFSTSTTSRALGNYGRISPETRERVLLAAAELGYRPNMLARSMITGRTETLGVVCADMGSPFFAEALRGVTDHARQRGFSTLIVNTDENPEVELEAIALLREKQVEGVIVAPADVLQVEHLRNLQREGRVVLLLDRSSSAIDADSVTVDDVGAMRRAVETLIDAGHRRIGIVTELRLARESDWESVLLPRIDDVDPGTLNPSSRRLLGYLQAHRNRGVAVDPHLVGRTGTHSTASALETALRLLRDEKPSALITVDNTTSVGAFSAVRELDLRVPEDLSLIAFDNLDWTTLVTPALSVIEQPVYDLGVAAAKAIIDRLGGSRDEPCRDIMLPTRYISRGSVSGPAQAAFAQASNSARLDSSPSSMRMPPGPTR